MAKKTPVEPVAAAEPKSAEDFSRRGWIHLTRNEIEAADSDFRTALSMNPNLLDAVYGLGMALKSQNRADEAIQAFNQAIALLDDGAYEDKARAAILRRIIRAQRIFVGAAPEQAST